MGYSSICDMDQGELFCYPVRVYGVRVYVWAWIGGGGGAWTNPPCCLLFDSGSVLLMSVKIYSHGANI